jgi:hypothetical protein
MDSAEAVEILVKDCAISRSLYCSGRRLEYSGKMKEEGLENDGECSVCGEEGVARKDNEIGIKEKGFRERRMNGAATWVGGLLRGNSYCGVSVEEVDSGRGGKGEYRLV